MPLKKEEIPSNTQSSLEKMHQSGLVSVQVQAVLVRLVQ